MGVYFLKKTNKMKSNFPFVNLDNIYKKFVKFLSNIAIKT